MIECNRMIYPYLHFQSFLIASAESYSTIRKSYTSVEFRE